MSDRVAAANTGDLDSGTNLVVVCGLPGSGKTTVSEQISDRMDATLLRTDVIRKELHPEPTYSSVETQDVYAEITERAGNHLASGRSVVLDGTFRRMAQRQRVRLTAAAAGADYLPLKVECEMAVVKERIAQREGDASDADFEIHEQVREQFEPVPRDVPRIDNSRSLAATRRQVRRAVGMDAERRGATEEPMTVGGQD
jgi:predicted kinase